MNDINEPALMVRYNKNGILIEGMVRPGFQGGLKEFPLPAQRFGHTTTDSLSEYYGCGLVGLTTMTDLRSVVWSLGGEVLELCDNCSEWHTELRRPPETPGLQFCSGCVKEIQSQGGPICLEDWSE